MIIRRNSKEFKAIRNIVIEATEAGKKRIRLYVIQAGEPIEKRIDISELGKAEQDFYYGLNLESVLRNLEDKSLTLHKSDDNKDLYYFRDASRNWDLNPFSLKEKIEGKKLEEYAGKKSASPLKVHKSIQKKEPEKKESAKEEKEAKAGKKAIRIELPRMHEKEKPEQKKSGKAKEKSRSKAKAKTESKTSEKSESAKSRETEARAENLYGLKKALQFTGTNQLLFPEMGIRKQDLLAYYNEMSEFILPYLKDRPVAFKWHPVNIQSSVFNQSLRGLKNEWKGEFPEWLETYEVYAKKHDEKVAYMLCQDKEHLLFMVEAGCIEINPWHSRKESIENPDYIVLDLDPTESDFSDVVELALQSRKILDGLELPSYLKTSGNTGLHIYIALDGKDDYSVCRELPKFLCELIHLKTPEISSLERRPAKRQGKVYLDYLQNDMVKTIVAPYSLRPNEFAGVATPLEWDELNRKLDPSDFNLRNIRKRLDKKGDLFGGILKKGVNASKTLERLKKNYGFLLE